MYVPQPPQNLEQVTCSSQLIVLSKATIQTICIMILIQKHTTPRKYLMGASHSGLTTTLLKLLLKKPMISTNIHTSREKVYPRYNKCSHFQNNRFCTTQCLLRSLIALKISPCQTHIERVYSATDFVPSQIPNSQSQSQTGNGTSTPVSRGSGWEQRCGLPPLVGELYANKGIKELYEYVITPQACLNSTVGKWHAYLMTKFCRYCCNWWHLIMLQGGNLIVSLPTSGGKTLVAEVTVMRYITIGI